MGVKNRSSYASPCSQLRAEYHDCFNRWYSEKFSKGQWEKEECVAEWEKYRACLAVRALRTPLRLSGYPPFLISSPLSDSLITHQKRIASLASVFSVSVSNLVLPCLSSCQLSATFRIKRTKEQPFVRLTST